MSENTVYLNQKPAALTCEAKVNVNAFSSMRMECGKPATHIYGPECEAETGKLMYLCRDHSAQIHDWKAANAFNPVECPTHGRIGMVKDYLILKSI